MCVSASQVQDLPLHFLDATLLLPVVVEHTIDERSPLYGETETKAEADDDDDDDTLLSVAVVTPESVL